MHRIYLLKLNLKKKVHFVQNNHLDTRVLVIKQKYKIHPEHCKVQNVK